MKITSRICQTLVVSLLLGGLLACSGEPSKGSSSSSSSSSSGHPKSSSSSSSSSSGRVSSSSSSSGKTSSSSSSSSSGSSSGGPTVCPAIYKPVCSVEPQNLQCIKAPCPTGVYKTYSNLCASNVAKAKFISNDECGDLEGKPYFEEPTACTLQYAPVCGTAIHTAPCGTIPCPAVVHKTYGNACEASVAKAQQIKTGECGKLEDTPVTKIDSVCTTDAPGACAKTSSSIACITAPCPTHVYKTFNNRCEAGRTLATVVADGPCGSLLQGVTAGGEPPVKMVDTLPAATSVLISKVQFKQDVLTLTLGYSGCGAQHFDLYIAKGFLKSLPVQVKFAFKALQEEACDAAFSTEFSYDLLPLKQQYGAEHGEIVLPGIGSYVF
ncbi:MAG TPA: hypothetical protein VIZ65_03005 [Cellvibrionaceae bacterium]